MERRQLADILVNHYVMFEVLAASRRRSILGFRMPLGFCKGFRLPIDAMR